MCFIDVTKAYNYVDCTLLWDILERGRIPPIMLSIIRQFRDGIRARVRRAMMNFRSGLPSTRSPSGLRRRTTVVQHTFHSSMHIALTKFNHDSDVLRETVRAQKREKESAVKACTAAWQKERTSTNPMGDDVRG